MGRTPEETRAEWMRTLFPFGTGDPNSPVSRAWNQCTNSREIMRQMRTLDRGEQMEVELRNPDGTITKLTAKRI